MRHSTPIGLLGVVGLAATALAPAPAAWPWPDECGPAMELVVPAVGDPLCSHGDDAHLAPGAAAGRGNRSDGAVPAAPVPCVGDGIAGPRVEVLSLRAAGRSGPGVGDVRRWVGQVEWTIRASAEQWGARRHVRFATEPAADGCRVAIRDVAVAPADLHDFARMVSVLRSRGYDRADRKYLIFAADDSYCGLASAPRDDRPSPDNAAEVRTGYARVDRPCWDGADRGFSSTAAHELLHTLGAVQGSAPHAHGTAHCHDEWDVLCYADGGGTMELACVDDRPGTSGAGDRFNRLLDCGGDDYFRPDPPAGSYLATHWNVADSRFLIGAPGAERDDPPAAPGGSGRSSKTARCTVAGVVVGTPLPCSVTSG